MNFDFERPSEKLLDMAKSTKIDLKDPRVMEEFKIIQN
jgi:hypothetical protein